MYRSCGGLQGGFGGLRAVRADLAPGCTAGSVVATGSRAWMATGNRSRRVVARWLARPDLGLGYTVGGGVVGWACSYYGSSVWGFVSVVPCLAVATFRQSRVPSLLEARPQLHPRRP